VCPRQCIGIANRIVAFSRCKLKTIVMVLMFGAADKPTHGGMEIGQTGSLSSTASSPTQPVLHEAV